MNFLKRLAATAAACMIAGLTTHSVLADDIRLQGAGSTFVNPVMQRWVAEYQKAHPNVKIDYQSIGSGGGIKGITDKTIDFAASDAPLSKKDLDNIGGADNVVEFPIIAGGVVPAYNLPGLSGELKFSGTLLADIYLGKVTSWNDPEIAALNPGINLPNTSITPAWRSDGSGTTFIFTNYLSTQSQDFSDNIGFGKQVKWPAGSGGKGNDGVAAVVQQTVGAIGYIELAYADQNQIVYGSVQNKAGKFVKATSDAIAAASGIVAKSMTGNLLTADLWNQDGDTVYPIAGFTYIILYKDLNNLKSRDQAQSLADFLYWASHDGQKFAPDLHYAPISDEIQTLIAANLDTCTYQGQPIHPAK